MTSVDESRFRSDGAWPVSAARESPPSPGVVDVILVGSSRPRSEEEAEVAMCKGTCRPGASSELETADGDIARRGGDEEGSDSEFISSGCFGAVVMFWCQKEATRTLSSAHQRARATP